MGCLLPIVSLFMPRGMLFFIWILTDWLSRAYTTSIWPFLGFVFMPYTTLAYMGAMLNNNRTLGGWWMFLFIIAIIVDLGQSKATGSKSE